MERAAENRAVAQFLAHAQAGPTGLVIEGEAGIGKTTLMLAVAAQAESRGFRILSSHGSPTEVTFAYAAVADLLRDVDETTLATLPLMQRVAVQRARDGADAGIGPSTDERAVAAGFLSVIECIGAHAPVLLTIDDAQWLDASSRAVIGYTARRLRGSVGVALCFRIGEAATEDRSWLQFSQPDTVSWVRVQPLSLGSVHALLAARLGHTLPRPIITRIFDVSGGNPLFALELAAATAGDMTTSVVELPSSLAALVRNRIGDTDDVTAAVLLTAACSVSPTIERLALATDMSAARVLEVLEPMEDAHVITVDGTRVRFTHPLFATGVYTNATRARRRAVHRTLAALTERPEIKARHLALAATTSDEATLAALDAAAEATFAQGAPAVAAELIELAIKSGGDTLPRRIRAGELHFRAGSLMAARAQLQAALSDAPPGILRCMALMWQGAVRAYDDDMPGAVESMSAAVDEAGDSVALRLLCLLRLAYMLFMSDRLGDALPHAQQAVELADQLGIPALQSQALSIWVLGKFVAGQGLDHEALQLALETEDPQSGATTYFRASAAQAMTSAYTGDLEQARTQMVALQQQILDYGTEVDIIWAAGRTAEVAVWSGRFAEASEAAERAVEHAEQMGGRLVLVAAWTQQASAAAHSGREAITRTAARASIDTANEIGAYRLIKEPTNRLALLELSLGNYPAALALLEPYLEDYEGPEIEGGGHLPEAIEALCLLGRPHDAEPLVDHLERSGALLDRPWMLAMGARGRGHILAANGDLVGACRAITQAMTHHQRLPMPFETARTQLLLGQLLRRRRRKQESAEALRDASDTFERLGSHLWAARARDELNRLDSPRRDGEQVTAAEKRTATLAAAGRTNKQIATDLYVSEKTVETNLTRVYRKLGVRSRTGLAAALQALGDEEKP